MISSSSMKWLSPVDCTVLAVSAGRMPALRMRASRIPGMARTSAETLP